MNARFLIALAAVATAAQDKPPEQKEPYKFDTTVTSTPLYTFGTTVVATTGFRGQIYHIDTDSQGLPNFKKLKPKGTIYTSYLYIPPQDFAIGFPGVTKRFEWFAIDYTGRFWVSKPGRYDFALASDDGSKLYIDGKVVIDNDGQHSILEKEGNAKLDVGVHRVRVSYFQGPRFHVALILRVWPPGDKFFRVFNLEEFKPPPDAPGWTDAEEEEAPVKKGKKK
jgi:PA14 domain-containing protein